MHAVILLVEQMLVQFHFLKPGITTKHHYINLRISSLVNNMINEALKNGTVEQIVSIHNHKNTNYIRHSCKV